MKSNRKKASAYWMRKMHLFRPDEYVCSACGKAADKAHKQCPACGLPMRKSKTDASWVDEAELLDLFLGDD